MSTRANVIVRGGEFKLYLYRHYDGYPAETGASLLEAMKDAGLLGDLVRRRPDDCAASLANRLLRSVGDTPDPSGRPHYHYEVTTEIHGDIEHLYAVRITNGGWIEIGHVGIDYGDERDDAALYAALSWRTVAEFAEFVNGERAGINARISARGLPGQLSPVKV